MKGKSNDEEILGLLSYFPKFNDINSKFFEITPGFNFAVAGSSDTYGFQLKIRTLFEEDIPLFYYQLSKLDYVTRFQTVDRIIDEAELLLRKHVSEFIFDHVRYKMFLRPVIVELTEEERRRNKEMLVRADPFVSIFETEMKAFIRKLSDKRDEISMELLKSPSPKRIRGAYSSFPYKNYIKNADGLRKLRARLLVDPAMIIAIEQKEFDLIFSGGVISERIRWKADKKELHYFIDCLNTVRLLKRVIKQPWALTSRLFMKEDGGSFTADELRNADELPASKDRIDKLVALL